MVIDECIVHSGQTASEFYCAINQLRREKKFHTDIYQQLPDRCCSCDGKTGLATIDLNVLRKICHDILSSWALKNHVPLTKNLNKLILKKRGKSKKQQIAKNAIKNELRHKCDEYGEWYDYDECLYDGGQYDIWEERMDNSRYSRSQLPISSKCFKATVAFNGCIAHNLKYVSKFRHAVQQLRRVSDFPSNVYRQLVEACCSCNGKKGNYHQWQIDCYSFQWPTSRTWKMCSLILGLNVIDPMILRDICYEIQPDRPVEPVDLIILPFGSTFDSLERRRKIGLLIGKKGRHLHAVQQKYNVNVNIVTCSSSMQLRQNLVEILSNSGTRDRYHANALYVILTETNTSATETLLIAEIKQTLIEKWNKISASQHFQKRPDSIR